MYAYQFRLIVVGDSTVGKSSLLRYFCDGKFCDDSDPTVGVDFYARIVEIKPGVRIKLQIWDTGKIYIKLNSLNYYNIRDDNIIKRVKKDFDQLLVHITVTQVKIKKVFY